MKYAVLESGGKQYIAREGETIEIDRLKVEVGKAIDFKDILLVVDNAKAHVGTPYVKGAKVRGTVIEQIRAPKVIVYKYIPKKRYRRKRGHRQHYTRVVVDKITLRTPRKKKTTVKASEKPEAKKSTRKPKTAASKRTTKKQSTATKKTAERKAKATPSKSKGKGRSSKASTAKNSETSTKK